MLEQAINSLAIEAAFAGTLGLDVEQDYNDQTLQEAHSQYRRIGLQETMILAARANGYTGRSVITQENLREVLQYSCPQNYGPPVHGSAATTVSLSGILSNVANKSLLKGYMEEDSDWREFASVKPVTDFKEATSYRMLDDMEYEKVAPNGEIAHGRLGQESYTRSADTYAKMLGITRTQIINDDLGAFDDIRERLGQGSARKFRRIFWQTFLSNAAFFTAERANLLTGANTALGEDGAALQLAITSYRKLKSTDGKQIGTGTLGTPTKLLVPPELEFVAESLYTSANVNTGGASTSDKVGSADVHRGRYKPYVVNELSDTDYANASATAWYLFGKNLKPLVVSFLNGVEQPTIESADADFHHLGVRFRGYHDFGVDQAEWLAGVKNTGVA
ncbi:MAG: hypothetical protein AAGD07_10310 [Planctomycetota bacterium]